MADSAIFVALDSARWRHLLGEYFAVQHKVRLEENLELLVLMETDDVVTLKLCDNVKVVNKTDFRMYDNITLMKQLNYKVL